MERVGVNSDLSVADWAAEEVAGGLAKSRTEQDEEEEVADHLRKESAQMLLRHCC